MSRTIKSSSDFDSALKSAGDKLVVIDFTASWCGPCKGIAPTFEALARSQTDVVFLKVDVDENQSVARKYGVRAMPTFLFVRKGAVLDTLRGANPSKLTSLTQQYSKVGVGMSGNFPGGGQTIGGQRLQGGGAATGDGGLLQIFSQIPKENLLPFIIVVGYIAYIFFGSK